MEASIWRRTNIGGSLLLGIHHDVKLVIYMHWEIYYGYIMNSLYVGCSGCDVCKQTLIESLITDIGSFFLLKLTDNLR